MAPLDSLTTPVTIDLDARGIHYRTFTHPGQVRSLEQAAMERGQSPDQVVRSILFRLPEQEFVMVLVSGPDQISWAELRRHLGVSRITMATQDEVLQATGYLPGSVAPFGLPAPIRILIDRRVFEQQDVSLGSGVRNTTIILRSEELRRALGNAEVGCFVSCPD